MEEYIRGDVFCASLEGDGSIQNGMRPVVIIQNDIGNKYSPTVIIAAITSQIKKMNQPTHVIIRKDNINNLKYDSIILLEQIRTINKSYLFDKIGRLNEKDIQKLNSALAISVALDDIIEKRDKVLKIVSKKILDIRDIEMNLALYSDNIELRDRLLRERQIAIDDAKYYCNKYGLDFEGYYVPFKLNDKIAKAV